MRQFETKQKKVLTGMSETRGVLDLDAIKAIERLRASSHLVQVRFGRPKYQRRAPKNISWHLLTRLMYISLESSSYFSENIALLWSIEFVQPKSQKCRICSMTFFISQDYQGFNFGRAILYLLKGEWTTRPPDLQELTGLIIRKSSVLFLRHRRPFLSFYNY